jgi:radical SAM superfamily enzyme YgiQ (UPF0313 family)
MKILLIYPHYPDTFWSYKHALSFMSKKALVPPLGILTVAAMLPQEWEKKLVDMNVTSLVDEDILWADYVFISAMQVQRDSAKEVISICNKLKRKIVAGGPLFAVDHENFDGVDHFVLGEAEVTLPPFLSDLAQGRAQPIYTASERADVSKTPIPLWSLLDMKYYATMNVQCSRGCPFDCEFCDIAFLYGREPRTKSAEQVVSELEALYRHGWRGGVFIVDDNFIGNKKKTKSEILPALIEWSEGKMFPFTFSVELSINFAEDEGLMRLMSAAGFTITFVGIETPNEESLVECHKLPNKGRDLVALVKKIHNHGFQVYGGFIVGFDSDPASIFKSQIDFIQESGIVVAMVSMLNALRGTRLYHRLKTENRLLRETSGDNVDRSLNFIPRMNYQDLINGYMQVLDTIYSPKHHYERIRAFFKEYQPQIRQRRKRNYSYITYFVKAIWLLGIVENGRRYFWKLLITTLFRQPHFLSLAIRFSIYRLHFYRTTQKLHKAPDMYPGELVQA